MVKKHREQAIETLFHAAQQAMALGLSREDFVASADAAFSSLTDHHKEKKKKVKARKAKR